MADSTTSISKREQKRQARLAKEVAEKSKINGTEAVDGSDGTVLPEFDDSKDDVSSSTAELRKSPYIEPVQKRIRNYLKKKQKIDQLSEKANDPEEAKRLNKDQLETLARKDQVLAPLRELQNLAEQFTDIEAEHSTSLRADAAEASRSKSSAVKAARQEGLDDGKKIVSSLIAFLGYASYLRLNPTADETFNDANERLLNLVYLGGDDSMTAAGNLESASDEKIDGTEISFKTVHDAIFQQQPATAQTTDETPEAPEEVKDDDLTTNRDHEYTSSNLISLSEVAKHPSGIAAGGISFLNESEIEGTHLSESMATSIDADMSLAPAQTLVSEEGNRAAVAEVDWSAATTTKGDWADEDSYDAAAPAAQPLTLSEAETRSKPQKPNLQPVSDFTTVEKKTPAREGGGRGRGHGRGRGERGGRGRGAHRGEGRGGRPKAQISAN